MSAGQSGVDTLLIPHNDLIDDPRPWAIVLDVLVDSIKVEMWEQNFARELGVHIGNSLDLGEVCAGGETTGYFEIWNQSNFDININNLTISAGETRFTATIVGKSSLPPSDSGLVEIIFTDIPESGLDQLATTISFGIDECPNNIYSTEVTVDIIRSVLILTGTSDFGEVRVGEEAETDLTLTNEGTAPAYITAADLSFTNGTETYFHFVKSVPPLPYLLNPTESMIVTVKFTPLDDIDYSTTFTVTTEASDDYCSGTAEIELFGKGIRAKIDLQPYDFGLSAECYDWQKGKVIVTNEGSGAFQVIADPVISGADAASFRVVNLPSLPLNIDPAESFEYDVEFNPQVPPLGVKTATFTLQTDDIDLPEVWTILTGTVEEMNIVADPLVVDFGAVPIPQTVNKDLILTNLAGIDAHISSVVPESAKVTVTPTTGTIAANGGTITLDIEALFDEDGPINGEVKIYFDEPCEDSLTVQVIGNGISGNLSYDPTLDFGYRAFCSDTILTAELSNIGEVAITVKDMVITGTDQALFDFVNPMNFDQIIEAKEMLTRQIVFSPDNTSAGIKTAELVVTVVENGETKDKIITLTAEVTSGLIATPSVVYLNTFINGTDTKTVTLTNQDKIMI
ncbi:MAG: choice-of-anchor D domain-containing protein, partial [Chlorobi bacterium]|nr:choice-of-anchor D domain-containing protein [Chlorobiota bacterium]